MVSPYILHSLLLFHPNQIPTKILIARKGIPGQWRHPREIDEKAVQRSGSHEGSDDSREANGISGFEWFAATVAASDHSQGISINASVLSSELIAQGVAMVHDIPIPHVEAGRSLTREPRAGRLATSSGITESGFEVFAVRCWLLTAVCPNFAHGLRPKSRSFVRCCARPIAKAVWDTSVSV
ncbi:hypothetical protein FIBSPDRAFT_896406 [Athelia psychrophila]|uniref:Uncharacterized protein n=1 Tax=Athelia psychrophila TaxID=1759441 RepID=A0A166DFY5_9AGAM|nr:hypothetical protein FIBSPDRAFT_896406 [Fibularhizoctonia sp. CBS 109695]